MDVGMDVKMNVEMAYQQLPNPLIIISSFNSSILSYPQIHIYHTNFSP